MSPRRLLMLCLLLSLCGEVQADQGCAPGFYPGGNQPNGPICIPIPGYGTTNNITSPQPAQPSIRWFPAWGAFAHNASTTSLGVGGMRKALRNRKAAEDEALATCRANGGGNGCAVLVSFKDSCGALAIGMSSKGDAVLHPAKSKYLDKAQTKSLKKCQKHSQFCELLTAECAFGEAIRPRI